MVDFTLGQRQRLYEYLEINRLPENRYYLYNFFFDNCATRIRDAFVKSSPKHIKIIFSQKKIGISFRQLIKPYIKNRPWLDLGMNIALGSPADKTAKTEEFMFLPDHLMDAFQSAVQKKNNISKPVVKKNHIIFKGTQRVDGQLALLSPKPILWFLFVLIIAITYIEAKKNKYLFWIDRIIFGIIGFVGILLLILWFATDHDATANNFNLLWAIPFHLPIAFITNRKQNIKFIKVYFLITGIIMLILIFTWKIIPQELHNALIPLIFILAIRSFIIYSKKRVKTHEPHLY